MNEQLGRYEIIEELGQGAMGTVYKARDPMLDRVVAIKTINLKQPEEDAEEFEARFYQEARAAGQLSHPNIVTIYDVGKSGELAYMAMEYLEGRELRSILGSGEMIPIETALDIGAQVADGLGFAHERHVIHRDIKPANVMVLKGGVIKITDFGIARMRNNEVKTMTGMILGSPKYMSPEQVAGKRADQRSDLFSLGVVIYEMLTGTSPFVADNVHGVMYQTLNFTPPSPTTLNADLPDVLNYIVAKVLAKNTEDRYQSASDLANDLRQARTDYLQGATTEAIPQPLAETSGSFTAVTETLTRREDQANDSTGTVDDEPGSTLAEHDFDTAGEEASSPHLRLSSSFDSTEATGRMAAIFAPGHEPDASDTARLAEDGLGALTPELEEFSASQQVEHLKALARARQAERATALSASTTWGNRKAAERMSGVTIELDPTLRLIWIGSAVALLAAMLLLIFS